MDSSTNTSHPLSPLLLGVNTQLPVERSHQSCPPLPHSLGPPLPHQPRRPLIPGYPPTPMQSQSTELQPPITACQPGRSDGAWCQSCSQSCRGRSLERPSSSFLLLVFVCLAVFLSVWLMTSYSFEMDLKDYEKHALWPQVMCNEGGHWSRQNNATETD